ncbi:MAG: hypothetical protein HOY71_01365, partial [Nonomuraea sp.]|nr:hypothetical protein [Nonomuraea sp.]
MSFADNLTFGGRDGVPNRRRRLFGISIGLVYLAVPLGSLIAGEVRGAEAVWGALSIVAFLICYIATTLTPYSLSERGRWTIPLLAATTLIAVVSALALGGAWLTMPIFMVVLFTFTLTVRGALVGMGAML